MHNGSPLDDERDAAQRRGILDDVAREGDHVGQLAGRQRPELVTEPQQVGGAPCDALEGLLGAPAALDQLAELEGEVAERRNA